MRLREVLDLIHVGPPQQYPRGDRPFTEKNCSQFHPGEPLLFALNHHVCIFAPVYGLLALPVILIAISGVPVKSNRYVRRYLEHRNRHSPLSPQDNRDFLPPMFEPVISLLVA